MGEQPPTRTRSAPVLHHRRHAPAPVARVTLLDAFAVTEDGIERGLSAAAQRLVALVALHGRPVRRDYAATTLWPHLDARIAGASLRSTLSRVRSASPYLMLAGSGDLGLADGVCVDVFEFDDAASHVIDGTDGANACDIVWRGRFTAELLPGWDDEWVLFERERLREVGLHAIEAQAAQLASEGQFTRAITAAYTAIGLDPLRESAVRTLIEIHLAEGNRAQVARCYMEFRHRLRAALGIEPSGELTRVISGLIVAETGRPLHAA